MKAVIWITTLVYWVVAILVCVVRLYSVQRDTDALINRAQVAADREDMLEYLMQLKANLEHRGMTRGHFALIWKMPDNDMALHYKAVTRYIERLRAIGEIPKTETAYQTALDDLRGSIRELPNPAEGWVWVRTGWWLVLIGLTLLVLSGVAFWKMMNEW